MKKKKSMTMLQKNLLKKGRAKNKLKKGGFPHKIAEKLWNKMWNQHFFQHLQLTAIHLSGRVTVTVQHTVGRNSAFCILHFAFCIKKAPRRELLEVYLSNIGLAT